MRLNVEYYKFNFRRCFGIELEFGSEGVTKEDLQIIISENSYKSVIVSAHGSSKNNNFWHVKNDSSCGRLGTGRDTGLEIASFKACSFRDLQHVANITKIVKQFGCKTNKNCGFHVHVDVSDYNDVDLGRIIAMWYKIENIFMNSVPKRRRTNAYCKTWKSNMPKDISKCRSFEDIFNLCAPLATPATITTDRRYNLNVVNYITSNRTKKPSRKTVEFRFPEGTLSCDTVKNWTRIFVNFIQSLKRDKPEFEGTKEASFEEFMRIIGLNSKCGEKFKIFSKALNESRVWICQRVIKYSSDKDLQKQARIYLEGII